MTIRLHEGVKLSQNGKKFRIQLLSEGIGSSGTYPADVIQRDGPAAWPSGTQLFFDHITEEEMWQRRGQHSVKELIGVTTNDPIFNPDTRALEADVNIFPHASDFINSVKDHVGLSVEADGTIVDGIVESIIPSPLNSVAVVPRAGRDGKILGIIEAFRDKINTDEEPGKEMGMKPEEIAEVAKALAEAIDKSLDAKFTALTEALKPAPAAEPKEDEKVDISAVAEAMVAAELPEVSRKRIYEALQADEKADVTKLIESEKTYRDEIAKSLKESLDETNPGRLREAKTETFDAHVSGW